MLRWGWLLLLSGWTVAFEGDELDPFQGAFRRAHSSQRSDLKESMRYWQEGEDLRKRCDTLTWPEYLSPLEIVRSLRTLMTAYQREGLAMSSRAIAGYGQALGWPLSKRKLLGQNLVQQYCSPQMVTFSRGELLQKLTEGKAYDGKSVERKLEQTIALFRLFCSWGGKVRYPRLLGLLLQDPQWSAFILRKLASVNSSLRLERERLYCHYLRRFKPAFDPRYQAVGTWIAQTSAEDIHLMSGQLAALATGEPSLILEVKNYRDVISLLRPSYRKSWNQWSQHAVPLLAEGLRYEESLHLEVLPTREFGQVLLGVMAGGVDALLVGGGNELVTSFPLFVAVDVLHWVRRVQHTEPKERIRQILRQQVAGQVLEMKKRWVFPPWSQGLSALIAESLFQKVVAYKGKFSSAG